MTANEVFRALFWMTATGYVIYVAWSLYRLITTHAGRVRKGSHPMRR